MITTKPALATVAVAAAGLFAAQANANLMLTPGDAYYLGFVKDGEPADATSDTNRINSLLDQAAGAAKTDCSKIDEFCDRLTSTLDASALPDAITTGAFSSGTNPDNIGIDVTGWTYLLTKYDGPNWGDEIFYVSGIDGLVDVRKYGTGEQWALSHYALYNPTTTTRVPEPATLTLLSLGLLGVGFSRAKSRRQKA